MPIDAGAIKQFIKDNVEQLHTREDIAGRIGISLRRLEKEFRQQAGMTLTEYVKREKFRRVRLLLESTDLRCYEIGLRVGLGTAESIAKAFRRRFGMTMMAYRRTYR